MNGIPPGPRSLSPWDRTLNGKIVLYRVLCKKEDLVIYELPLEMPQQTTQRNEVIVLCLKSRFLSGGQPLQRAVRPRL